AGRILRTGTASSTQCAKVSNGTLSTAARRTRRAKLLARNLVRGLETEEGSSSALVMIVPLYQEGAGSHSRPQTHAFPAHLSCGAIPRQSPGRPSHERESSSGAGPLVPSRSPSTTHPTRGCRGRGAHRCCLSTPPPPTGPLRFPC